MVVDVLSNYVPRRLEAARTRRQEAVARAREKHLQLRGELDGLQTVTLTDAARVAAALAAVENVRTMVSHLNTADVHRRAIQDPADEPASVLLERIRAEKATGPNGHVMRVKKGR